MGSRQRKNFLKLFRKYIKHKKDVIDWCVRSVRVLIRVAACGAHCLLRKCFARAAWMTLANRARVSLSRLYRNAVKPPTPEILLPSTSLESCPNDMNLKHELLDKLVRTNSHYFILVSRCGRVILNSIHSLLSIGHPEAQWRLGHDARLRRTEERD